jgi:molybdate/tungstate transport system substrate-binding protein
MDGNMGLGRRLLFLGMALAAMGVVILGGCKSRPKQTELRVFLADSLYLPFKAATDTFQAQNPTCQVTLIPSGSVLAARKIADASDQADVLAVADYLVIEKLLRPRYADWYACFATNEVVIAYTQASKGAAELTADNWFDVLARDGVKVGAANPYHDPCGYWAEICWQLADLHYTNVSAPTVRERMTRQCGQSADRRSDTEELLQLLESSAGIDYAFVYLSQARQHRLPVLRLPAQINLGDISQADFYRRAVVTLPGTEKESKIEKRGEAIVYAVTIPKNARHPELAVAYIRFLISEAGRKALSDQHMVLPEQPWTHDPANVPGALKLLLLSRPESTTTPSDTHAHTASAPLGS